MLKPSVANMVSRSMATYRSVQYVSQKHLQSYAPRVLMQKPFPTVKTFSQVNLPKK